MHKSHRNGTFVVKGQFTAGHLIHESTKRIQIASCVNLLALSLLGADIGHCSDSLVGNGKGITAVDLGNTEVRDLDKSVAQKHDVLGLDVTVNDPVLMGMLQSMKDLLGIGRLPDENEGHYSILSGMLMYLEGRIPAEGDSLSCCGWIFEVVDMDGNRIDKVLVRREVSPLS